MRSRAGRLRAGALLGLMLVFPSFDLMVRHAGHIGGAAYALIVMVICLVASVRFTRTDGATRPIRGGGQTAAISIMVAAFSLIFAVTYPAINARGRQASLATGVPSGGSDRDDALNVGVQTLLAGRNPYTARTYLDNPISPLPGSLLLAVPFAWLGNAAVQNVLWFAVWLVLLARLVDARFAVTILAVSLIGSPVVLHDLLTGGDLAVNAIVVLVAIVLAAVVRPGLPLVVAAIFAGVAFATRLPFALLLPLLAACLHRRLGLQSAAMYLGVLAVVAAAITLPFYLADPAAFTPWHTQNKFRFLEDALPSASLWLPMFSAVLSLCAPVAVWRHGWPAWLVAGGIVLLLPVALYSALAGTFGATATATTGYALPAVFFAVPGLLTAAGPFAFTRSDGNAP